MGRTLHEVLRIREVRDHRTGGTVVALDPSHAGADRDPEIDVLRLVQPLSGGRDRSTAIVHLALEEPDLSPRELAVNFTDTKGSFVSEATVYRLLKERGLITSPAFILLKAADRFANPTTAPNQLWQTDFTYLKVIGWGWFYLSTVLDDFSRYILAWKLCTTMAATDVSDTLQAALQASGLDQVKLLHRPRLLSDNGSSYVSD